MLIGYKMRDRAMMAMVSAVVHQVEVLLEVVAVVVFPREKEVRWCDIIVTKWAIWIVTFRTPPQPVVTTAQ